MGETAVFNKMLACGKTNIQIRQQLLPYLKKHLPQETKMRNMANAFAVHAISTFYGKHQIKSVRKPV